MALHFAVVDFDDWAHHDKRSQQQFIQYMKDYPAKDLMTYARTYLEDYGSATDAGNLANVLTLDGNLSHEEYDAIELTVKKILCESIHALHKAKKNWKFK